VFGAIKRELRRRSAVGHNFRRILSWLRDLLRPFLIAILRLLIYRSALIPAS
jgi:hypothetical protein